MPPRDIFPKAAWAYAGFNTPEAALRTIRWATLQGDLKTLKLGYATPEEQDAFAQSKLAQFSGKSESEIAEAIGGGVNDMDGYRIVERTTYANGDVGITYYCDGTGLTKYIRLQQVGDEWRIAPGPRGGQP